MRLAATRWLFVIHDIDSLSDHKPLFFADRSILIYAPNNFSVPRLAEARSAWYEANADDTQKYSLYKHGL